MELQRAKDATISILSTWWPKPLTNIPHANTHTQHMHSQSITFDRNDNYTNRSNIFETEKKRFRYKWFECTPYNCINISRVSPDSYSVMCTVFEGNDNAAWFLVYFLSRPNESNANHMCKKNEQTSNIFWSRTHLYCASHSKNSYPLFVLSCLLPFSVHFVASTPQ